MRKPQPVAERRRADRGLDRQGASETHCAGGTYAMSGHVWDSHDGAAGPCPRPGACPICDGGLLNCVICGGAEASLPTECPGHRMTATEADAVQADQLDFIDGNWNYLE